jgi:predicted secreted Zn-dependent protease
MKKLLIIAIIIFNVSFVFAQTQKYDIMTYTPPKGWTVQNGDNAKVFTKIDKAKNTLGIIMLYPSINSSGDANDDFKYVWKQIVQDSFGARCESGN